jgi:predicted MFS family arabinose efflux permease
MLKVESNNETLICILGLTGLISVADNWIISPVLPAIAGDFDISIAQAGVILTTYMIPYGIMQPVYGFISDRWGKANMLRWLVAGLALGTMFCATATSLYILCFGRAVTGFFAAGIIAVSLALIGDTVPFGERQHHVGKFTSIVALGQGLSVGMGGVFAKYISWRIDFVLFAIAAVIMIFFLRELPKDRLHKANSNFFSEVKNVIVTPKGIRIFPLSLFAGVLLLGLYSYLGAFLHEIIGLDYLRVGIVIMFFGFASLLAGSQVGNLVRKIGQQRTIIFGGCLSLTTALILAVYPCWQAGWLATVSLGFGYVFIQATLATIAFDIASENKGLVSGLIGLGLFGGGGLGTTFSGWLLSQGGYQAIWLTFSVAILIFVFITGKVHFD